eukprot:9404989-Alexandrium_andersonii.AAC.1
MEWGLARQPPFTCHISVLSVLVLEPSDTARSRRMWDMVTTNSPMHGGSGKLIHTPGGEAPVEAAAIVGTPVTLLCRS